MPAPNLGLVGAMGVGALQQDIQRMEAERRAAEQLAYKRQQDEQAAAELSRHRQALEDYQRRNLTVNELEAKNRADALAAAANKAPEPVKPVLHSGLVSADPTKKGRFTVGIDPFSGERKFELAEAEPATRPENLTPVEEYVNKVNQETVAAGGKPMTAAQFQAAVRDFNLGTTREPQGRDPAVADMRELNAVQSLQKQWDTLSQDYRDVRGQVSKMNAAWREVGTNPIAIPAASEALQVLFQKTLDPGSVVREGEFLRSLLTQSMLGRISGYYNQLLQGGTGIDPKAMGEMITVAQSLSNAMEQDLIPLRQRTVDTALRYKLDPVLIVGPDSLRSGGGGATTSEAIGGGTLSAPISIGGGGSRGRGAAPPAGGGASVAPVERWEKDPKTGEIRRVVR